MSRLLPGIFEIVPLHSEWTEGKRSGRPRAGVPA